MDENVLETYNLKFSKFDIRFIDCCTNFKELELGILRGTFAGIRLGKIVRFKSFATMSFSDEDETNIITITAQELGKFGRGKTNAVVFSIEPNEKNKGKYDRCMIYQHSTKNEADSTYGYIMFNTETGITNHVYCITRNLTDLTHRIQQSLDNILWEDYCHEQMHKIDEITAAHNKRNKKIA